MRAINKIIIHCSDTPEGKPFTAKDIDRWHKERKFRCIGYHYVVLLDGTIQKGRPLEEVGAHCAGYNKDSIGICYIGGRDKAGKHTKDTRTDAQKKSLVSLLKKLKERFPSATIYGHRNFAVKDCPCFNAKSEYSSL